MGALASKVIIGMTAGIAIVIQAAAYATPYNRYHINEGLLSAVVGLLGKPLPKCKGSMEGVPFAPTCYKPDSDRPTGGLVAGAWDVSTYNGIASSFGVRTHGVLSQAEDFKALTKAFGTPTKIKESEMQNLYGARFHQIDAYWETVDPKLLPDVKPIPVKVSYTSCCWYSAEPELTEGNLIIIKMLDSDISAIKQKQTHQ